MKLLLLAFVWLLFLVAIAAAFTYVDLVYFTPKGAFESDAGLPKKPIVLALACLLGIFSKALYDQLQQLPPTAKYGEIARGALAPRRVLGSLIVCPVIVVSFYSTLSAVSDLLMIALLSYQNGFFFQSVLSAKLARGNAQ